MTPDVNVFFLDIGTPREAVTENADGSYTIFINSRLSYESQLLAYKHAMKHIESNDFEKNDVQEIEAVAHEHDEIQTGQRIIPTEQSPIPDDLYLKELERLCRRHKKLKKQMKEDEKRIAFLREHCDMFARAEHLYLYNNDL